MTRARTQSDPSQSLLAKALAQGRLAEAERLCAERLQAAPGDFVVTQLAAELALRRRRYDDARRLALSCLKQQAHNAEAMLIAGRAARGAGDAGNALHWFAKAAQAAPERPEPVFELCVSQLAAGDPQAQTTLQKAMQQFPAAASGWNQIGLALRDAKQMEAALVAFGRAAKFSEQAGPALNLGQCLLALGRAGEAAAAYRRALELEPQSGEALFCLGQALRAAGALNEALACLQRRAAMPTDDWRVHFHMGLLCDDLHDAKGAIASYRRCIGLKPNLPEAHFNLAIALQREGEFDAALQSYRSALRLRADIFGRIAQALPAAKRGQLWLNLRKLRQSIGG